MEGNLLGNRVKHDLPSATLTLSLEPFIER
jgi:hypothetical protein